MGGKLPVSTANHQQATSEVTRSTSLGICSNKNLIHPTAIPISLPPILGKQMGIQCTKRGRGKERKKLNTANLEMVFKGTTSQ